MHHVTFVFVKGSVYMNFILETRNILNVFFDIFVSSGKATYDACKVRKKIEHKSATFNICEVCKGDFTPLKT